MPHIIPATIMIEIFALSDAGSAIRGHLLDEARALCGEHRDALVAAGVPIDAFQSFSAEIAALPADFVPPRGGLWLALLPTHLATLDASALAPPAVHLGCRGAFYVIGIVALREHGNGRAEIKRLFVRAAFRRLGAATALSAELERAARTIGYSELVLDSLDRLSGTRALYTRLGFETTGDYNGNPMEDVFFMRKALDN